MDFYISDCYMLRFVDSQHWWYILDGKLVDFQYSLERRSKLLGRLFLYIVNFDRMEMDYMDNFQLELRDRWEDRS